MFKWRHTGKDFRIQLADLSIFPPNFDAISFLHMKYPTPFVLVAFLFCACHSAPKTGIAEISLIDHPAAEGSRYPHLHTTPDGKVLMSWLQKLSEGSFSLKFATLEDGIWSDTATIFTGDDFFDNWADFPSVTWSPAGYYAAHWLRKVEGGYFAYHVQMAFSDDGRNWSAPITPHLDLSPSEHGFVSLEPLPNGRILAVWLDGRNTAAAFESGPSDHAHTQQDQHAHAAGAMTLRSAEIGRDGSIHHKHEIDARVCDCCPTSLVRDDLTAWVVYRNRSQEEVRDFYIVAYDIANAEWGSPSPVHADGWQIGGCPVNGAALAVLNDELHVSWFTAAGDDPRVLTAAASTEQLHFGEPVRLSTGDALGRVNSAVNGTSKGVLWMEEGAESFSYGQIYLSKLPAENDMPVQTEVEGIGISRSRLTGFPQLTALPGQAGSYLLAWTRHEPSFGIEMRKLQVR